MSAMSSGSRKSSGGGELDVYTGLLLAAFLVLLVGVFALYTANTRQVENLSGMTTENALFGLPGFEVIK
jgi:hypothetical protein